MQITQFIELSFMKHTLRHSCMAQYILTFYHPIYKYNCKHIKNTWVQNEKTILWVKRCNSLGSLNNLTDLWTHNTFYEHKEIAITQMSIL